MRTLSVSPCTSSYNFVPLTLAQHASLESVIASALNDATLRVLTANGCEVVVPDGQFCCGFMLKEYDHFFTADEPEYAAAAALASKTRDVTEFLATLGLSAQLKPVSARVTYQDSCHLLH